MYKNLEASLVDYVASDFVYFIFSPRVPFGCAKRSSSILMDIVILSNLSAFGDFAEGQGILFILEGP